MKRTTHWTLGLAAAGLLGSAGVIQAQEAAAGANALAASTTLSGYISTSYRADSGTGTSGYSKASASDRFSLDVVDLKFASAQGQGEYSAGYTFELWLGPLAKTRPVSSTGNNTQTVAVEQANIDLHLPVGSGLDLKIGHFNTIVGYESDHHSTNPHFTQSWGLTIEPTHHTGILGSYTVSDNLSIGLGLANTAFGSAMNATAADEDDKALLAKLNYTLPDSLGLLGGNTINLAYIDGQGQNTKTSQPGNSATKKQHLYAGIRDIGLSEDLTMGLAYDLDKGQGAGADNWSLHTYLSYTLSAKATLNFRYGYVDAPDVYYGNMDSTAGVGFQGDSYTTTLDYKLWENVVSRIEWRHDKSDGITGAGSKDADSFYINLVYIF